MVNIIWLIWSISYGPYDIGISFTLQHSFLAVLFSYKFHCTVDHKYHHSKIRFEHTLKHNLHFFGSSHLALLVPNVCILNIKVLRPKIKHQGIFWKVFPGTIFWFTYENASLFDHLNESTSPFWYLSAPIHTLESSPHSSLAMFWTKEFSLKNFLEANKL